MSKITFKVVVIRPGMHSQYMDYWRRGVTTTPNGTLIRTDQLAFIEFVDAKNKIEAEQTVQAKFPNHSIDSSATQRFG